VSWKPQHGARQQRRLWYGHSGGGPKKRQLHRHQIMPWGLHAWHCQISLKAKNTFQEFRSSSRRRACFAWSTSSLLAYWAAVCTPSFDLRCKYSDGENARRLDLRTVFYEKKLKGLGGSAWLVQIFFLPWFKGLWSNWFSPRHSISESFRP
jgi:hypothetical protein